MSELVASADAAHVPPHGRRRGHRAPAIAWTPRRRSMSSSSPSCPSRSPRRSSPGSSPAEGALRAAEERGLLTVQPDGVAVPARTHAPRGRRRLPTSRRIELNARLLAMLRELGLPTRAASSPRGRRRRRRRRRGVGSAGRAGCLGERRAPAGGGALSRRARARRPYDAGERAELMQEYRDRGRTRSAAEPRRPMVARRRSSRLRRQQGDATALGASLRWARASMVRGRSQRRRGGGAREASAVLADSPRPRTARLRPEQRGAARDARARRAVRDRLAVARSLDRPRGRRARGALARAEQPRHRADAPEPRRGDRRARRGSRGRAGRFGNFMDDAARAYVNLVWSLLDQYRLDLAEQLPRACDGARSARRSSASWRTSRSSALDSISRERDGTTRSRPWLALEPTHPRRFTASRSPCRGLAGIRRGDPGGEATLEEAWTIAVRLGELQRPGPWRPRGQKPPCFAATSTRRARSRCPAYDEADESRSE